MLTLVQSDASATIPGILHDKGGAVFNVQHPDFGAKGNGDNNDTQPIQDAIDAAGNYGTVFLPTPSNFYKTIAPLNITKPVRLVGAHEGVAIKAIGLSAGQYVVDVDGSVNPALEHVGLENVMLLSDNSAPDAVRLYNTAVARFKNVRIFTMRHGVTIAGNRGHDLTFEDVECYGLTGDAWLYSGFIGGGQHTFTRSSATSCNFGVVVDATSALTGLWLTGCNFEQNASGGIAVVGTVHTLGVQSRFEKNARDIDLSPSSGNRVHGLLVNGSYFNSNNQPYAILINGAVVGFRIAANVFNTYSDEAVFLNGNGDYGTISENMLEDVPAITNTTRPTVTITNNVKYSSGTSLYATA